MNRSCRLPFATLGVSLCDRSFSTEQEMDFFFFEAQEINRKCALRNHNLSSATGKAGWNSSQIA